MARHNIEWLLAGVFSIIITVLLAIGMETAAFATTPIDLGVSVTPIPESVQKGDPLKYTIVVKNHGPSAAENIFVDHQVVWDGGVQERVQFKIEGEERCAVSPGPGATGNRLTCHLGDMSPNKYYEILVTVVPLGRIGTLVISTGVGDEGRGLIDENTSNDAVTFRTTVVPRTSPLPQPPPPPPPDTETDSTPADTPGDEDETGSDAGGSWRAVLQNQMFLVTPPATPLRHRVDLQLTVPRPPYPHSSSMEQYSYGVMVVNNGPDLARGVTIDVRMTSTPYPSDSQRAFLLGGFGAGACEHPDGSRTYLHCQVPDVAPGEISYGSVDVSPNGATGALTTEIRIEAGDPCPPEDDARVDCQIDSDISNNMISLMQSVGGRVTGGM